MKWKSIASVLAGVLFVVLSTTLVDVGLHLAGVFSGPGRPLDDRLAAVALAYRIVLGVAGGWLTARLAPRRPMRHALILGAIGTLLGVVGAVVTWNRGLGPHWYPVAVAALALPQCWLGGRLHMR